MPRQSHNVAGLRLGLFIAPSIEALEERTRFQKLPRPCQTLGFIVISKLQDEAILWPGSCSFVAQKLWTNPDILS